MKNNLFGYTFKKQYEFLMKYFFFKLSFLYFLTWNWEKRVLILNRVTGFSEFHRFLTGFAGLTQIRFLLQLETGKKAESRSDRSGFQNTAKRGCPLHISIWKKKLPQTSHNLRKYRQTGKKKQMKTGLKFGFNAKVCY